MSEEKVGCTVPAAEVEGMGAEAAPAEEVKGGCSNGCYGWHEGA